MAELIQQGNQWRISGDVLMANAKVLLDQSAALSMESNIEIDFSEVTDVDTVALSLMLEWQRRATKSNCNVTYSHLPANLISLADLYGVTDFIVQTQH
jgi:phospholipid transport system transporter-binding protein